MDSNILEELLNRVKKLEEGNNQLRIEIAMKKDKLLNNDKDKQDTQVNLEDQMAVDSETFHMPSDYEKVIENRLSILENVKEVIIQYIPFEQYNSLYLMGDFTGWEPKEMNKNKDVFSFPTVLIRGFKYYYCISFRDQMIVDMNNPYEQNPRNGQVNNYVDMLDNNNNSIVFDYQQHMNILIDSRKMFTKARMRNHEEVFLLEKLVEYSGKIRDRANYLNSQRSLLSNKIMEIFNKKIEKVRCKEEPTLKKICELFTGRVIKKGTQLLEIINLSLLENCFQCVILYDKNGIKVNRDSYLKNNSYYNLFLKDYDASIQVLSLEESEVLIKEYNDSNKILKVFYKQGCEDLDVLADNSIVMGYKGYYNYAKARSITPIKIEPDNLDFNAYSYEVSAGIIYNVKNKEDNLRVLFASEEMKDPKDLLPPAVRIYYSFYKKTVNILHLHVLQENLTLDANFQVFYIDRKLDPTMFATFSENEGNLKIVCRNFKPVKAYYKNSSNNEVSVSEIKIEDIGIKSERIVKITATADNYFNNYYAKIKKIPIYALAQFEANFPPLIPEASEFTLENENADVCTVSEKDNLPSGYVDLSIHFDPNEQFLEEAIEISLPVCMVSLIPSSQETSLESRLLSESKKSKCEEMILLKKMIVNLPTWEKYQTDAEYVKTISQEELKKTKSMLEGYQSMLPKIGTYIERNDLWKYLEKLEEIRMKISSVNSVIEAHMNK